MLISIHIDITQGLDQEEIDLNNKILSEIGKKRLYNKNFNETGKDVLLWEVLKIETSQIIIFRIIETNSKYKQGVRIAVDYGEGFLEVDGIKSKSIQLWEDTCPKEVKIQCFAPKGVLSVYNIFDLGLERGGVRSQVPSCGMLLEEKSNIFRYSCNDAGFQTNFDKLVFEIELI